MSADASSPSNTPQPFPPVAPPRFDPDKILPLIADPTRYRILRSLIRGGEKSVVELAAVTGREQSLTGKHLAALRSAGFVVSRKDASDKRRELYALASAYRPADPKRLEIDFGFCLLRLG